MMLFLSLPSPLSPNSSPFSFSHIRISSSLLPNHNNNNNNNDHQPNSLSIPKVHSDGNVAIKAPTPPWMTGPLLLQPHDLLHFSNPKRFNKGLDKLEKHEHEPTDNDKALTAKVVRGKKVMKKIVQRVENLHRTQNSAETQMGSAKVENFGVCLESLKENEEVRSRERMPWEKDESVVPLRMKKEKALTAADLTLDKELLTRLRDEAATMRIWVKVKKAGVTQAVVDEIKRTWRRNELAMVKFDIPLCLNMDRAREIVETKTGGLVVWSKKDALVVYRGCNHQLTSKGSPNIYTGYIHSQRKNPYEMNWVESATKGDGYWVKFNRSTSEMLSWNADHKDSISIGIQDMSSQPVSGSLYERETDRLLHGLGPRFIDWWMHKPLPVDADLLPEVVPGFKPPFRLCPPHASAKLTDKWLTYLRRLAKPLPTHFVLGRNKGLKGLAAAILKLWEKSLIAKIAIKYGVPNTNNEMMANELKCLTGGVLLLRNKFYIVLYRGNDFLPRRVAALVEKRELEHRSCQLHEEVARTRTIEAFPSVDDSPEDTSTSGTLTEFRKIQTKLEEIKEVNVDSNIQLEAEIYRLERELKEEQRKAFILNKKIEISAGKLSKLNAAWTPAEHETDLEIMTDEERECFRKIGLKMRSCLVLGRRGVFDGVLEGLHQHWKHREVVKVITMQRRFSQVIHTAKFLEAESGGVIVSVDKLKEGHAIIIYRGKNYRRPSNKISKNLLTKRKALRRSLEMQRIGSLKFFAHQRQQTISDLKLKLASLQQRKEVELREFEN
ncbi:chloroplastic group IIA intron splicing facilitator CRS1, chloroplastic-like [Gastrolobium bilobum]|uniref:chloroplastic group IIA intron splicing facilitator CRS1, chloroplastic-like n=1 Tax=Gastrolobium bilobum TaxID=150636 RepID=UPI002AAF1877|nr:chloroplastic group IIA intron splicing facilitator CRS1, chloroplastic-like [Gastrolobium bilobum]